MRGPTRTSRTFWRGPQCGRGRCAPLQVRLRVEPLRPPTRRGATPFVRCCGRAWVQSTLAPRMFTIRGENVYPSEIDAVVNQLANYGGEHRIFITREGAMLRDSLTFD